ncbi:maestro heat-like repeat-containing protein family member 7 [Corvus cornix cornix]|uniref:maestro heat-like repeat-containing protein family member 7 n=1 Tax=Corvus cornix cornix TaxID=932674 RepID=UPI0019521E99|nr:maestro heat-like repeat-containing protein family member 7 [Corvus cornix cornix]
MSAKCCLQVCPLGTGAIKAQLHDLFTQSFPEASLLKVPSRPDFGMAGRFLGLFKVFRGKKREGPGAASAHQPEELKQFQQPRDDAAMDRTQEHNLPCSRFRRTAQMFRKFVRVRRRKTSTTATEGTAEPDSGLTELQAEPDVNTDSPECSEDSDSAMNDQMVKTLMVLTEDLVITNTDIGDTQGIAIPDTTPTPTGIHAPSLGFFEESAVSSQQQVPAMVRNMHQRLGSHVTVDARLSINILRLAEEHPVDVVLTLLRCAPSCDRAAAMMWRIIGSSGPTLEKVLPTLLCVMEHWPLHSMCTSDGDNKDVFALAATLVLWMILLECHKAIILYSGRLFVALLFQVVITTQQMPEEVDHFWRACREEHRLPTNPNRVAVQAMKALLCRLRCDSEVMAMERKNGWDMLLCADTQHDAVALLAREMHRIFIPLSPLMAFHLFKRLSREEPRWDLPFLAFLVEVLRCLDLSKHGNSVLEIMSRYLQSECRERHLLALRGLVVLSKDPVLVRRKQWLKLHWGK